VRSDPGVYQASPPGICQAIGRRTYGAKNGPQGDYIFIYFREPIQPRWPRTMWSQLLGDILWEWSLLYEGCRLSLSGLCGVFGQLLICWVIQDGSHLLLIVYRSKDDGGVPFVSR
jgi:hypothetical protein